MSNNNAMLDPKTGCHRNRSSVSGWVPSPLRSPYDRYTIAPPIAPSIAFDRPFDHPSHDPPLYPPGDRTPPWPDGRRVQSPRKKDQTMAGASPPKSRKLVRQQVGPFDKRTRKGGLTKAVRIAIDALMFDRCTREDACKRAGFTERALYLALAKPEVATYWNAQLQVLRQGERARNLHRLTELREQTSNTAASVKAIQELERGDDQAGRYGFTPGQSAGLVIQIVQTSPDPVKVAPTIEHDRAEDE
jgi:hypothetical protein